MIKCVLGSSLLILFLLVAGCAPTADQSAEEIVIGVAWPLEKVALECGVDLAVKEINASGGINGKHLNLIKKDDSSELVNGLAVARYFADNSLVKAVIGHFDSFISVPASAIYDKADLSMISPGSTAPQITDNGYEHVFRIIPSDYQIAHKLVQYLAENGYHRLVIHFSDDAYGRGLAAAFETHAVAYGLTIIDRFTHYTGIPDLERLHTRWRAFGFDGLLVARKLPGAAEFIRDVRLAGIEVDMFGGDGLDMPSLLEIGEYAEGVTIASAFNRESTNPKLAEFVAAFSQEYGSLPEAGDALGYDAVKMIAQAIAQTDLDDRSLVAEKLRQTGPWKGVSGTHHFNQEGENITGNVWLKTVTDGGFRYIAGRKD